MRLVIETMVPVFCVIAVGYALAGRRRAGVATLADLGVFVTSPALLFTVLSTTEIEAARWAELVGGALWVALGTGALSLLYLRSLRVSGDGRRGLLLVSMFWNAGNMGLACARLAFGPEGLEAAIVVFVTMAVLSSSLGIWIAKGEGGLREALRIPLLHASLAGVGCSLLGVELPRAAREPLEMLAAMAIPLLLVTLGMQLRALRIAELAPALAAVGIRMLGGLALGGIFVGAFDVGGVARQVLLLNAAMPPAVMNALLAERYGTDPELVASAIILGTLASLASIPAVLLLVS